MPAGASRAAPAGLDALPPELLIVGGALSVQGGAGLATQLMRQYGPLPVVAMRTGFGALLLLALRRPAVRGATREALLTATALGVILAAMNSTFYLALSRIPLGVAVTIEFWGPLAVAVVGSRRRRDLVWVTLAAVGIYLLTGGRLDANDVVGVLAAFGAGLGWALYILTGRRLGRAWPDGTGLTLAMVVSTAFVVPAAALSGGLSAVLNAPPVLLAGVAVAVFSAAIPFSLEMAALRRVPASTFGVLMSLEPAIAAVVGFIFLSQALEMPEIVAIGLVALASAGASWSARRLAVVPGELEAG